MQSLETRDVIVPNNWNSAKIWARTFCDENMNCYTGFCGNAVQCGGAGPVTPVTLVQLTLNGRGSYDHYNVSLLDGYNLVLTIEPIEGTFRGERVGRNCGKAGSCYDDLNPLCPAELSVKNHENWTAACMTGCQKYKTDQQCCRGAFANRHSCSSNEYAKIFKTQCPTAYAYAYDDLNSSFICRGSGDRTNPDYKIIICG